MEQRGQWRVMADGARALATVHPSWVLRQPDDAARGAAYALLKQDLQQLAEAV
jgi:DNA polymerase